MWIAPATMLSTANGAIGTKGGASVMAPEAVALQHIDHAVELRPGDPAHGVRGACGGLCSR